MSLDMNQYFGSDLVTIGQLRSPEMLPPPYYNDDDSSPETFQSCVVSIYNKKLIKKKYINNTVLVSVVSTRGREC